MKGQGPLQWIFIVLLVTLMLVAFMASPLNEAMNEGVRNNVQLKLQEISSIMSIIESSPGDMKYVNYPMPEADCTLKFQNGLASFKVKISGAEVMFSKGFITRKDVQITSIEIPCKGTKSINFEKKNGKIMITSNNK